MVKIKTRDRVYLAIQKYTAKHGYPPTVRELCEMVDLKSTSTVHGHIQNLIKEGKLERDGILARAVKSTNNSNQVEVLEYLGNQPSKIKWNNQVYQLQA